MTGRDVACLTGRDFLDFFAHTRNLEVKVKVNDTYVPVAALEYDNRFDGYVIHLDEDSEDYEVALTTDPLPELDG